MDRELRRRAFFGALIGAGTSGAYLSALNDPLEQFSPLSGSVWDSATPNTTDSVDSPYGSATVRYDEYAVPHVSADDEQALYFAVGYTQASDRLFQMDLQRRLFRGTLSAVVGSGAIESDRFHRKMAFVDAAKVTAEQIEGTPVASVVDAYTEGVNKAMEQETYPIGFQLLGYEPDEWTRTDTALIEKIIAWNLTGTFETLRTELVRDRFEDTFSPERAQELLSDVFPYRLEQDTPIIRDHHDAGTFRVGEDNETLQSQTTTTTNERTAPPEKSLVDWVSNFDPPQGFGSNSWVVGPEHTESGAPILANDPHLGLQAPPTWYEMHIDGPDHRARGVSFPGTPVVVIGENDHGAWGFTNANSDVIDFYRYDHDGETYQYGDERREFEIEVQVIEVDGGPDEKVTVRKSVHGPVIEEAEQEVGIAWTGHTATETMLSLYELSHSTGLTDAQEAAKRFDCPTQNLVYADQDGNTLYYMTGRIPLRRTDGTQVPGNRVFDGSAKEGEWDGFEPFGESSWDGFVPLSANPQVVNPEYIATANQQIIPDENLDYYLSAGYTSPYRGRRIYDQLDQRIASGAAIDLDYLRDVGRDTVDGRAVGLVDPLVDAARNGDENFGDVVDTLAEWDYRMDADSRGALIFDQWWENYRDALLEESFKQADLDDDYYPSDGAIEQLSPDSSWFGSRGRASVMREALRQTVDDLEELNAEIYGDLNNTGNISHLTELEFLDYPSHPRGGSGQTVWNFDRDSPHGGSWEMQADLDGELLGLLPGGNSGRYFSDHYDDQIAQWANGEYRTLSRELEGDVDIEFKQVDE